MSPKASRIIKLYRLHRQLLARRPYLVEAVQTGTIMGLSDLLSQTIFEKKSLNNVNFQRTVQFASVGFFFAGPVYRLWLGILDRNIGKKISSIRAALKKMFLDQVIFAPGYLFLLLSAIGLSQRKSLDDIKTNVYANYFDVLQLNYCLWPIVQLLNFYYIPIEYQNLVLALVALCWDTYLSWKLNGGADSPESIKKSE